MDISFAATLRAAGYITVSQLDHHFGMTPDDVALKPWMVMTDNGVWDGVRYRPRAKQAHWALRTEVYLRLAPRLTDWRLGGPAEGDVVPDALMQFPTVPQPVALEVDTGKENAAQWQEKLVGYRHASPDWNLLVVGQGGPLRRSRLTQWLELFSPLPWQVAWVDDLVDGWECTWTVPALPADAATPETGTRAVVYWLDGAPIAKDAVAVLWKKGYTVGAHERRHGQDLYYLIRP